MIPDKARLYDDIIDWEFAVEEQGFMARYGQSRGHYYRQLLFAGQQRPLSHPPKLIDKRIYDLAVALKRKR